VWESSRVQVYAEGALGGRQKSGSWSQARREKEESSRPERAAVAGTLTTSYGSKRGCGESRRRPVQPRVDAAAAAASIYNSVRTCE
jgi:hypothetical protein